MNQREDGEAMFGQYLARGAVGLLHRRARLEFPWDFLPYSTKAQREKSSNSIESLSSAACRFP